MTVARAHTRHWSRKLPHSDRSQTHEQQDNAKMVRNAQQQIPRWLTSSSASTAAIGWSSSPLSLMRTPVDGTGAWYGVRGGSIDVGSLNSRPSGSPSCPCSHSPHTYTTPWRVRGFAFQRRRTRPVHTTEAAPLSSMHTTEAAPLSTVVSTVQGMHTEKSVSL